MTSLIDAILLIFGMFFILVAAIGLLRMPDLMIRMHAATKAGTVGAGFIMLAVANHFGELSVIVKALLIILFLLGTAPVASHLIGRAAYKIGIRLWDETIIDELDEHYEREANSLPQNQGDLYDPVRIFGRGNRFGK